MLLHKHEGRIISAGAAQQNEQVLVNKIIIMEKREKNWNKEILTHWSSSSWEVLTAESFTSCKLWINKKCTFYMGFCVHK